LFVWQLFEAFLEAPRRADKWAHFPWATNSLPESLMTWIWVVDTMTS